jgi:tetratricopeptide (TPR) repeat protein
MSTRRITWLTLGIWAIVTVPYGGLAPRAPGQAAPSPRALGQADAEPYRPLKYVLSTEQAIQQFHEQARRNPNALNYTLLGQMYIRKARESGDFANYEPAETAIRRALELDPASVSAQATLAQVLCANHKFAEGLRLALQVYHQNPRESQLLLLVGDAHLELGHYAEAEKTYQEVRRQDPLAYVQSRAARLAELHGNPQEALRLMQQAVHEEGAAALSPESRSWYEMRLGEMSFNIGHLEEASRHYEAALHDAPRSPAALAGRGRLEAAQGKYEKAIEFYKRAVVGGGDAALLAELGDLYTKIGNPFLARLNYDKLEQLAQNKPAYNRELALFFANHDRRLTEALELAKADLALRQDVYAYDTLAWALHKNGHHAEAVNALTEALQLGTQDAQLFYHAGKIYVARGQKEKARDYLGRALALNPRFSVLHADEAQQTFAALGGKVEAPASKP